MSENIISIGKNLDIKILAEGIETIEQKDLLTEFSKPLKINQLEEYLLTTKSN
jgi:sensor c-di-GMP phosphodiesterase-like protein